MISDPQQRGRKEASKKNGKWNTNVRFWATVCKTVRPMPSDRCLFVCPVLSVMFVHCGQTVGRIKVKRGTQAGIGPGHTVLDGDPAPLQQRGTAPTQFSAHICCGQMASWIKVPLGMEVGLSTGDFVLDGNPAPPKFLAHVYYSYCDFVEHCTMHSRYWFVQVQVQVLVFYAFYF